MKKLDFIRKVESIHGSECYDIIMFNKQRFLTKWHLIYRQNDNFDVYIKDDMIGMSFA